MSSAVRVAKHRIKQSLNKNKPVSINGLRILKEANIDIKPFIDETKKIYDSLLEQEKKESKT